MNRKLDTSIAKLKWYKQKPKTKTLPKNSSSKKNIRESRKYHLMVIFVPRTPNGELVKHIRTAYLQKMVKDKWKIVERAGDQLQSLLPCTYVCVCVRACVCVCVRAHLRVCACLYECMCCVNRLACH